MSILVLAVYACKNKEDEVSLPVYEDTIKLSTYLISVDGGGGEVYVTAESGGWSMRKSPLCSMTGKLKKIL